MPVAISSPVPVAGGHWYHRFCRCFQEIWSATSTLFQQVKGMEAGDDQAPFVLAITRTRLGNQQSLIAGIYFRSLLGIRISSSAVLLDR